MNMIDMNVLRDLTNAFGPSGFEEDVVRAVRKHCTGMSLTNDAMNNVYARIGGNAEGRKPVLMLDAHTDECGFMVQGIMENGLLSLIMLGGMWNKTEDTGSLWSSICKGLTHSDMSL